MRILSFILTMFIAMSVFAQKGNVIAVWPNGAPNSNGVNYTSKEEENKAAATLTVYIAKKPNGQAIVDCPGGAYSHLALGYEGHDMAAWFNAQGITYAVLKYRMPNGNKEVPLSDALEAIRIMKRNAEEWGIKSVGIMGFSAGGHLASSVATHFTEDSRPDFQILFYPVISMDPDITHHGSRNNLLGKNPSIEDEVLFSNELQINERTPQAFITHSSNDRVVPVENAMRYALALSKNRIPYSMHIYPIGGHGWGYNDSFIYKKEWTSELEKWLREINK